MSFKIKKTVELEVEFPFVAESEPTGVVYLVIGYDEASSSITPTEYVEVIRLKHGHAAGVPFGIIPAENIKPIEKFTIKSNFKQLEFTI